MIAERMKSFLGYFDVLERVGAIGAEDGFFMTLTEE